MDLIRLDFVLLFSFFTHAFALMRLLHCINEFKSIVKLIIGDHEMQRL